MVAAIVGHVTFSAHPRNRNPVLLAPHRQDQQPPQPGKLIRPIKTASLANGERALSA